MPKRTSHILLTDMEEAIKNALEFTKDLDWETFSSSKLVSSAVLRQLEVLGEVARLMPEEAKAIAPYLPWRQMAGLRNRVIHEYFDVSLSTVWQVVQKDLPGLLPKVEALKAKLTPID